MRALVVALLLLTIVLVALPGPATAASPTTCTQSTCNAIITRTIATNSWGVTVVSDKVVLDSTSPVSHLTIGVPTSVCKYLHYWQENDKIVADLQVAIRESKLTFTIFDV